MSGHFFVCRDIENRSEHFKLNVNFPPARYCVFIHKLRDAASATPDFCSQIASPQIQMSLWMATWQTAKELYIEANNVAGALPHLREIRKMINAH